MQGRSMVKNHDAGDVRGLEEVFRAQELRPVPGPAGDAPAGSARAAERPSKTVLGLASTAVAGSRPDDGVGLQGGPGQGATAALSLDRRLMAERQVQTAPSGGGAVLGEVSVAVSGEPPGKRETCRYWTLGSVSALVAPAGAGVSVNESHGHVTLSGAATTTGTAVASLGGSADRPPPSGGSAPAAPVAAGVGSAVGAVGSSATGLLSQVGSAVPTTTSVPSALIGFVDTVEQTVGATTL
jgi:hypothetical protein